MLQNRQTLPFTIAPSAQAQLSLLSGDLSDLGGEPVAGLVGLEDDHLLLQFRMRKGEGFARPALAPFAGMGGMGKWGGRWGGRWAPRWADWMGFGLDSDLSRSKTEVRELRIPLRELASAAGSGWWGRRITLTSNDLKTFHDVPGTGGDRVVLKIARRDRELADQLVADLQLRLSDLGIQRIDEQIARLEGEGS